ncbi:MAG TPA: response regulator [Steroidobacteraceae bacterium]|nr:response regulator [Steroidobacteraceae bacterium]
MVAKRALIVDDSKSARLFLARILEKYEIDVDNAENAEAAIEYLASHRPDVIFMDHLMPGMDGFQAVQAIKNNPLTATIPIMMYTSQEGELYLGQARALGAVGVLPKQIKPTDVSKVLYQLHLLADRRSPHQTSFRPLHLPGGLESVEEHGAANESGLQPKLLTETNLREQFAELRRALVAGVDTQTERITAEVRALLLEALPPPPPEAVPAPATLRPVTHPQWSWIVAAVALTIALVTTALWWQQLNQLHALAAGVAQLRHDITERAAAKRSPPPGDASSATPSAAGPDAAAADAAAADAAAKGTVSGTGAAPSGASARALPTDARPLVVTVPYGGEALGGPRLEVIRQLLDRLVKESRSAVVDIKSFAGRFCLVGNASDGFSVAPDETLFSKCDVVGNPPDDALSSAQRIPLSFANLVGGIRSASRGTVDVQTSVGDATVTAVPYPQVTTDLGAAEWNRAASANNRIEIRLH